MNRETDCSPVRHAVSSGSVRHTFGKFTETLVHFSALHVPEQTDATIEVELFIDVMQMELGRTLADREMTGDRLAGQAFGDHACDFQFPGRQCFGSRAYACPPQILDQAIAGASEYS